MSTHESVGSYEGHSYQTESSGIGYSSGHSGYATIGYPATYYYLASPISVHVYVAIYGPLEDEQMAALKIVGQLKLCQWTKTNMGYAFVITMGPEMFERRSE
ncbi:hypothetical protein Taro_032953 [Colocasia esculenta]|uniref:Uncharacterized protein n=1 Tax=Colocasia esculenta TaxID=4460 RepID=A0A843VSM5_COLES|nr:hypothetical protein [Colocasia esculenta]